MKIIFQILLLIFLVNIVQISRAQNEREKLENEIKLYKDSINNIYRSNEIAKIMRGCNKVATDYIQLDNKEAAIEYYGRTVKYADIAKIYNYQYIARKNMAKLYEGKGDVNAALNLYKTAFDVNIENNEMNDAGATIELMVKLYGKIDPRADAISRFKKEFVDKKEQKEKELAGQKKIKDNRYKANNLVKQGKINEAIPYLKKTIQIADSLDKYPEQYQSRLEITKLYELIKSYKDAIKTLNDAFDLSLNHYKDEDAKKVVELLGKYYKLIGESEDRIFKIKKGLLDTLDKKINASKSNQHVADNYNLIEEVGNLKDMVEQEATMTDSVGRGDLEEIKIRNDLIDKNQNLRLWLIIAFVLLAISVIAIGIVIWGYMVQIRHKKELSEKNKEIEAQSIELKVQNEELSRTLANFDKTQKELIQKSQMASLGQLMAGIAHEINTPMGSIKSSINTVIETSHDLRKIWPNLMKILSEDQFHLFLEMLDKGLNNMHDYNASQERSIRKIVIGQLQKLQVKDFHKIADSLIDAGIHEIPDSYLPLFENDGIDLVVSAAYHANIQIKNGSIIRDAVERVSKILFALKYYSFSSNDDEMVKSDIVKGIESVLTLYYNQLKHRIKLERDFEILPEILCFPEELNQVWTNLLNNSIHAIKGVGKINVSAKRNDNQVIVTFEDNGCGIPESIRDRIFEPFFTTKEAGVGTGLGLDIIKKIVEKHNGKISFESKEGQGTTFKISLPLTDK
jgi:signal transduction histidine kinase